MRKLISLFLAASVIVVTICGYIPAEAAYEPNLDLYSESIYMVSLDANKLIYEKNKDVEMDPASLTKIMTCILALESVDDIENTMVEVPLEALDAVYGLNASNADLRTGEILSMKDLLYALMLPSACEAAETIAYYVGGGSRSDFVSRMNQKAQEIGAANTNFINASGLPDSEGNTSITTAYDIYLITQYALNIEGGMFESICSPARYEMAATNKHESPRNISHTNEMLRASNDNSNYYEYVKGIKTGTSETYENLVSLASKDGYNYLLIVMGSPNLSSKTEKARAKDSIALYNWAFENFKFKTVANPGEKTVVNSIRVNLAKDTDSIVLTTADTVTELLPVDVSVTGIMWDTSRLPEEIDAPINKGDVIGEVDLKLGGEVIQTVTVIAAESIERSTWLYILNIIKNVITSWWFLLIVGICVALLVLYIVVVVMYNRRHKKKRKRKIPGSGKK